MRFSLFPAHAGVILYYLYDRKYHRLFPAHAGVIPVGFFPPLP